MFYKDLLIESILYYSTMFVKIYQLFVRSIIWVFREW